MNGAESLLNTLINNDITVCFTNPGTSEMHFVAALDEVEGMRCVLCLFEGVLSGAADGYARMARKPASTLLHLGPGLGNALANIHNAKKGHVPMVNIVGDHATYHLQYDAPLTADIEGIARPVSDWVHTARSPRDIARDTAEAIRQAGIGRVATLMLPADVSWGDNPDGPEGAVAVAPPAVVPSKRVDEAIARLVIPPPIGEDLGRYSFHPAILDAGFQMLAAMSDGHTFLPVSVSRLALHGSTGDIAWAYARVTDRTDADISADIEFVDENGETVAAVRGLVCRPIEGAGASGRSRVQGFLYERKWIASGNALSVASSGRMPISSAAMSMSRMAIHDRPMRPRTMFLAARANTATKARQNR